MGFKYLKQLKDEYYYIVMLTDKNRCSSHLVVYIFAYVRLKQKYIHINKSWDYLIKKLLKQGWYYKVRNKSNLNSSNIENLFSI